MSAGGPARGLAVAAEHEFEAAWGLPEPLPPGERLLWQGRPQVGALLRHVFHLPLLALYFGALLGVALLSGLADGQAPAELLRGLLGPLLLSLLALALLGTGAWLISRTTAYTLTDRRVVMRIGIVLCVTYNLPLRRIEAAGLRLHRDGSGDLPLLLHSDTRIGYLHLWPHARPWQFRRTQPMLRAVPQAERLAALMAQALRDPAAAAPLPRTARHAQPLAA